MIYNPNTIFSLGTLQTCLMTALLYMIPLNKKKNWLLRLGSGVVICLLLSPFLASFRHWASIGIALMATHFAKGCLYLGIAACIMLLLNVTIISMLFRFCCQLNFTKSFCGAVCSYITQDFAYTLYVALSPMSANRGTGTMVVHTLWLELTIMAVIYVSFYFLFARQLPQHGEYRFSCGKMLIIMLVAMLSSVVMGSIGKALYDKNHTVIFRLVLVYDLLLSLCLLAMLLLHKMGEQVRATCIEEKHLHLLHQQQYELMQETIETINHKCHDLKHQISLLRSENSALNRERIFQELERDIMIYDSHIHTGNTSLDELLTEKFLHCDRLGVQWTCMADGKVVTFIDPIDLYTLLGNALENAIESAMKVDPIDKRFLSVNILRKGNMVLIRIENYCQQNLVFYDGLPVTTKPNQSEHGFGMRSIQNITQRYHGELNVHMEGEQFKLSILIPIPNDIDE